MRTKVLAESGVPVEAAIRNAHRTMYLGKHLGRNRVEISGPRA